jgi:hypothetical protein
MKLVTLIFVSLFAGAVSSRGDVSENDGAERKLFLRASSGSGSDSDSSTGTVTIASVGSSTGKAISPSPSLLHTMFLHWQQSLRLRCVPLLSTPTPSISTTPTGSSGQR